MHGERISVAPCLPWFARRTGGTPYLRPAIIARRTSLQSEQVGTLTFYTNASHRPAHGRARPLILLHGIHASAGAHEMRLLFEACQDARPIYAPDLPGFGSSERGARSYTPELYVEAIERLIEHATPDGLDADVVAVGLTCEYAAQAAVHLPGSVRSLTLIAPTGFAVKREQGLFERASRRGKRLLLVSLLMKLGVSSLLYRALVSKPSLKYRFRQTARTRLGDELISYRYATSHQPGAEHAFLALLSGELIPSGNPQSVYTRVHCPTLILHRSGPDARVGSLESFVKWHEYYAAEQLEDLSLLDGESTHQVLSKLRPFWTHVAEQQDQDGAWGSAESQPKQLAASH